MAPIWPKDLNNPRFGIACVWALTDLSNGPRVCPQCSSFPAASSGRLCGSAELGGANIGLAHRCSGAAGVRAVVWVGRMRRLRTPSMSFEVARGSEDGPSLGTKFQEGTAETQTPRRRGRGPRARAPRLGISPRARACCPKPRARAGPPGRSPCPPW